MKKILYMVGLPLVIIALLFSAIGCEGPVGPQGIQGIQGETGAIGPQGSQGVKGDTGEPGTGTSIVWMGTATSAPKSWRVLNYAYYNSYKGKSYIWDGNSWEILARDGATGATGATGPRGYTGATGADGADGADGAAGADGADGADGAPGAEGPQGLVGQIVAASSTTDHSPNHGSASLPYQTANVAGSVVLGEGDWMIVASGAIKVSMVTVPQLAINIGLRTGEGEAAMMLAKSNIASESMASNGYVDRLGFALVGTITVPEGETLEVKLVHFGGGNHIPFEWNIVAIGGMAP